MARKIIVISGFSKGSVMPFVDDLISVGRDTSNTLSLGDPAVSRRHCRIEKVEGGYELIDLESQNGTFLNAVPVGRFHATSPVESKPPRDTHAKRWIWFEFSFVLYRLYPMPSNGGRFWVIVFAS